MSREIQSPVTGTVWKIEVAVGGQADAGDDLIIVESMKMEIPIEAPCAGTIKELMVKEEDSVVEDQVVALIES